jgi:diaminopimelate epimerase
VERWHAHGNVYGVVADPLTADDARRLAEGTDGIVEVAAAGDDWAEVRIWNPDGSLAELSGNATRIAARWVAARTGAQTVTIRVGERPVVARMLDGDQVEQDIGAVRVGEPEEADGIRFTPVDVGNPHAVVEGDPGDLPDIGPRLETHPRFPQRTNVQVARIDAPGRVTARVWERGVGETQASGTSAVAVAAATHGEGEVVVSFPGGDLTVRLHDGQATLIGPAEQLA